MAAADGTPEPDNSPRHQRITEKRALRRPLGSRYAAVFFVLPVLLTVLVGYTSLGSVEGDLHDDAVAGLSESGIANVRLELDGRDVTALVPTGQDPEPVQDALARVSGIASVQIRRVYASKEEERACTDLQAKLDKVTNDQRIPFAGTSKQLTANGLRMMGEVATLLNSCGQAVVTVGGHADSRTSNGSTLSLQRARVMVRFLRQSGVGPSRLKPRGYGDQFPISDGRSPSDQAANHRGSVRVEGR